MTSKPYPEYGCRCDLDPGEKLTDCVINDGDWSDCTYGATSVSKHGVPRIRKTPNSCQFWVKNED